MFQKLQAKAQAALSAHSHHRTSEGDDQPVEHTQSQTDPTQQSGGRHHALDNITHTLKQLHTQYSPQVRPDARQLQMVITSQKGVALDFEAVSRDSKSQSKELYLWGQEQVEDVKDVSDRVAYLNFVQGTLASELAKSLDTARASYKSLRDAETALHPRRTARSNMRAEIERIKTAGSAGKAPANGAERVVELQNQLTKAETDDAPQEREVALLKRRALVECERKKWVAFREYGAKLALIADASEALLVELPEQEPQGAYTGAQNTARIRSQLQNAIDSYTPAQGQTNQFKAQHAGAGVGASADTRSFGETHKDELNSLPPTPAHHPASTATGPGALAEQRFGSQPTAGAGAHPESTPIAGAAQPGADSVTRSSTTATTGHALAPINPTSLNHAPASIPTSATSPSVSSPLRDATTTSATPAHIPSTTAGGAGSALSPSATTGAVPISGAPNDTSHVTVAETGVPVSAGPDGPGPKSGSLSRDKVPTTDTNTGGFAPPAGAPPAGAPQTGMAPPAHGGGEELPGFAGATHHESAEEEKARLAREERERLLHGSTSAGGQGHLSAEEEKARLEREERERVLRGQQGGQDETGEGGKTIPPPYADF